MNAREKLIAICSDGLGFDKDFLKDKSDMDLVVIVLEHIVPKVEEFEDHTHTIS